MAGWHGAQTLAMRRSSSVTGYPKTKFASAFKIIAFSVGRSTVATVNQFA
jgi:hypothetical protein